jgi:hypothetical protein
MPRATLRPLATAELTDSAAERSLLLHNVVRMPRDKAPGPRFVSPDMGEAPLHWRYRRFRDGLDRLRTHHDCQIAEHPQLLDSAIEGGVLNRPPPHKIQYRRSVRRDSVRRGVDRKFLAPYTSKGLDIAIEYSNPLLVLNLTYDRID